MVLCKYDLDIFVWRVTWNYAYSTFHFFFFSPKKFEETEVIMIILYSKFENILLTWIFENVILAFITWKIGISIFTGNPEGNCMWIKSFNF